jgi:hypothetical protein
MASAYLLRSLAVKIGGASFLFGLARSPRGLSIDANLARTRALTPGTRDEGAFAAQVGDDLAHTPTGHALLGSEILKSRLALFVSRLAVGGPGAFARTRGGLGRRLGRFGFRFGFWFRFVFGGGHGVARLALPANVSAAGHHRGPR